MTANESVYTMTTTANNVFLASIDHNKAYISLVDRICEHFKGIKTAKAFGEKRAELVSKELVAEEYHDRIPSVRATLARLIKDGKVSTHGWISPTANTTTKEPEKLSKTDRAFIKTMLDEYAELSDAGRKAFRAMLK